MLGLARYDDSDQEDERMSNSTSIHNVRASFAASRRPVSLVARVPFALVRTRH
jgi:hypothetical protein